MIRPRILSYALIGSLIIILVSQTGCSGITATNHDITLTGSAEGLRAFADYQNGLIRTGKEDATKPSEFLAFRNSQEREVTKRATAPGFLGKLFAKDGESTAGIRE
jgi:hypothetical protein